MGLKILDHAGKPVEHGRVRLSTGVRLHYYTAGSGPALLLQHGVRFPFMFLYPRVLYGRILMYSGIGRSQKPATTGAKSSPTSPPPSQ
jgi:hypothetical protein